MRNPVCVVEKVIGRTNLTKFFLFFIIIHCREIPNNRRDSFPTEIQVKKLHLNSNPSSHLNSYISSSEGSKTEDEPSTNNGTTTSYYYNGDGEPETRSASAASSTTSTSTSTDVKRVRALFENNSSSLTPTPGSEDETRNKYNNNMKPKSFLNGSTTKVSNSTTTTNYTNSNPLKNNGNCINSTRAHGSLIRSAYSQLNLNQMERYDFVDLLVNDNIIIEDSPDIFQTLRNTR